MKHKKQKQVESQQTVKQTVDKTRQYYDNMLSSMLQANVDSSKRIAENKQAHVAFLETKEVQEARKNKHAYKTKEAFKVSTKAYKSRRSYIIALLHENKYTKADINKLLLDNYDIADKSNNLKAISGTIYDISSNTTCDIKIDNETDVCSCISANCKYKV